MKSGESRWFLSKYLLWRLSTWITLFLITPSLFSSVSADSALLRSSILLGHSLQLECYPPVTGSGVGNPGSGAVAVAPTPAAADYYIVQWKKQGSPSPVLLWRQAQASREGRGYEGRVSLLERAALLIVDARSTDAGLYECQTWDVTGQSLGNGTSTNVQVFDAIPRFVSQPVNTMAAVGTVVQLNCTTDPVADQVLWLRNGASLSPGAFITVLTDHLQLTVSHEAYVREQQQGTYQCMAVWGQAALRSVAANLTIAVLTSFKEQETVKVTCQEGGNVVLVGSMPDSLPPATPIVTHNGTILPTITPRTILMSSGNLHIQNVNIDDSGWYQFSAINSVTDERVTARNSIQLEVVANVNRASPQLLAAPKQTNVVLGGNTTLECAANGNPPPTIVWSKYGGVLPDGSRQILGNLQLFNLKLNDTGTYVCNASNGDRFPVSTIAALDVIVIPEIQKWTSEYEVREREDISLDCLTKGYVKSYIRWLFNGTLVHNSANFVLSDSKLQVKMAQREQAGFYQCFAENAAGVVHSTARLRVVPRSAASSEEVAAAATIGGKRREPVSNLPDKGWERKRTGTFSLSDDEADPVDKTEEWQHKQQRKKQQRRKKKKGQHNDENGDGKVVMIPPTRPDVTKLSDESVMVRWSVPENAGLPILFFKVQYRDVDKPNSPILTIDEDIAPHILSYEVPNLKTGRTYRFRIAAVYSNNDNKLGPSSHKFTLHKDPPMKKPIVGPTITHAEAISPSAIMIQWKYLDIEEVVIEGFFIYYRTTSSAGAYTKVTVLGANTPSHIISHLLPGTAYDIKMQSFNSAGTSDFSNIRTEKTNASALMTDVEEKGDQVRGMRPVPPTSNTAASDQLLHTILGTVLGSIVLLFIIFVSYCSWKQKRRRRLAALNSTGHDKENGGGGHDSSGKYATVNGQTAIGNGHVGNLNGVLMWNKPRLNDTGHTDHEAMAETSLNSPHLLINNNSVQGRRLQDRLQDAESGSEQSDNDEEEADAGNMSSGVPRPAACRPLIHRDSERQCDEDVSSDDEHHDTDGDCGTATRASS